MEQTINQEKKVFVRVEDLTLEIVKSAMKEKEIIVLQTTLLRTFSKNGNEQVSINVKIHDPQLHAVRLQDGKNYLSSAKFHRILLAKDQPYKDEKKKDIAKWIIPAYVRFVKGNKTDESEYYSIEVIYKQGVYVRHFLDYETIELINALQESGKLQLNWVVRPDKIDVEETILKAADFS